jgi:hypothetical protein
MRFPSRKIRGSKSGGPGNGFPLLNAIGKAADPLIDVVFVHGLGGDARSTWRAAGSPNSMLEWLAEDNQAVQVWSMGYPAAMTRWTDGRRSRGMPLPRRAQGLIEELLRHGIGQREIVFVCHSLGGLVVKQVLRHSRDLSTDAPRWKAIADSTLGVVFLATPHAGSSLASFAKAAIVTRPTASILALTAHCPHLEELAIWYRQKAGELGIETASYAESQPMPAGILVVNPTSADPAVPGCMTITLDADHVGICKPGGRIVPPYPGIKDFVDRQVGRARKARLADGGDSPGELLRDRDQFVQTPGGLVEAAAWLTSSARLPLVSEIGAGQVGVHRAIAVGKPNTFLDASSDAGPGYVIRTHDRVLRERLRAAVQNGRGIVILQGRSSTGKTRSLWEAARSELPGWAFADCRDRTMLYRLPADSRDLVVWLDELRPTDSPGALASRLRTLFSDSAGRGRIIVAATSWDPRAGQVTELDELRELAGEAGMPAGIPPVLHVLANWDEDERARAVEAAAADPRLATVLRYRDFGPAQVLGGAPWLFSIWPDHDPDPTSAVITAAVDLARLGVEVIDENVLRDAAKAYFAPTILQRPSWFADALSEATTPIRNTIVALAPVFSTNIDRVIGYRPSDLLQDYGGQRRHWIPVPESTWRALIDNLRSREELTRLADEARDRLLLALATEIEMAAATAPSKPAPEPPPLPDIPPPDRTNASPPIPRPMPVQLRGRELADKERSRAELLYQAQDLQALRDMALASDSTYVRQRLALLLDKLGEEQELMDMAIFSRRGARTLYESWARQGRIVDLQRHAACGDGFAIRALRNWPIAGFTDQAREELFRRGLRPDGTLT